MLLLAMYISTGAVSYRNAYYGQGSGSIVMDEVRCGGTESRLYDCLHTGLHDCSHFEDASVRCSG